MKEPLFKAGDLVCVVRRANGPYIVTRVRYSPAEVYVYDLVGRSGLRELRHEPEVIPFNDLFDRSI